MIGNRSLEKQIENLKFHLFIRCYGYYPLGMKVVKDYLEKLSASARDALKKLP